MIGDCVRGVCTHVHKRVNTCTDTCAHEWCFTKLYLRSHHMLYPTPKLVWRHSAVKNCFIKIFCHFYFGRIWSWEYGRNVLFIGKVGNSFGSRKKQESRGKYLKYTKYMP